LLPQMLQQIQRTMDRSNLPKLGVHADIASTELARRSVWLAREPTTNGNLLCASGLDYRGR
jgi:hypothetical protein